MLTLVRNIGSSIGISMVIANLTSTTTLMHARLAEHITPFNNALQQAGSMLSTATDQGRALLDAMLTQQATVIAYDNTFKLLMVLTLIALPLVLVIGSSRAKQGAAAGRSPRDGLNAVPAAMVRDAVLRTAPHHEVRICGDAFRPHPEERSRSDVSKDGRDSTA